MYIPDPIEILEGSIDEQISKVTADGKYPCCECGTLTDLGDLVTVSPNPAAPAVCWNCFDEEAYK